MPTTTAIPRRASGIPDEVGRCAPAVLDPDDHGHDLSPGWTRRLPGGRWEASDGEPSALATGSRLTATGATRSDALIALAALREPRRG